MKKIMLFAFQLSSVLLHFQTLAQYDEIELENAADYKAADSFALKASIFLLSTPFEKDNVQRQQSLQFLIKWMEGTTHYSFSPDADIVRGNDELIDIYMACMAKFCLENKALSKNKKIVKMNAVKLMLNYCSDPGNNVKMTDYLKNLAKADQKGELEKVL